MDDSTIREKRDHEEERRPRKRKRLDIEEETVPEPAPRNARVPWPKYKNLNPFRDKHDDDNERVPLEHDPVFFEEGPNRAFIRIENMLFKVSRTCDCLSFFPSP